VLRSVASEAHNTRPSIRANYGVSLKTVVPSPREATPTKFRCPADVAAFVQAPAPPIPVTRGEDFQVLKTTYSASGDAQKSYSMLARYVATLFKLHAYSRRARRRTPKP
jgi:hypothetical protein